MFHQAFCQGPGAYLEPLTQLDAIAAIRLTLTVAAISVPLNAVFGMAPPGRSPVRVPGKSLLVTFIDLPFSMSPVVSGLVSACSARRAGSASG